MQADPDMGDDDCALVGWRCGTSRPGCSGTAPWVCEDGAGSDRRRGAVAVPCPRLWPAFWLIPRRGCACRIGGTLAFERLLPLVLRRSPHFAIAAPRPALPPVRLRASQSELQAKAHVVVMW